MDEIKIDTLVDIAHRNEITPSLGLYDYKTPIVVLFGPPLSGKKCVLLSLAHFLVMNGYIIIPVRTLLPNSFYIRSCDRFREMIFKGYPDRDFLGFMLVDIFHQNGHKICQILVIPGQLCFFSENLSNTLSPCINQIISSPNPKVWIPFIDVNWRVSQEIRSQYIRQLGVIRNISQMHDKFIILINKVDHLTSPFHVADLDVNSLKKIVFPLYDSLFVFKEKRPIIRVFRPYNCNFIPFTSGVFCDNNDECVFIRSNPIYSEKLWKAIINCIK